MISLPTYFNHIDRRMMSQSNLLLCNKNEICIQLGVGYKFIVKEGRWQIPSYVIIPNWKNQHNQWSHILQQVCHENSKIQTPHSDKCKSSQRLFDDCNRTLDDVLKMRPEAINDGFMNIWIIKPGSSSRGRGNANKIVCVFLMLEWN